MMKLFALGMVFPTLVIIPALVFGAVGYEEGVAELTKSIAADAAKFHKQKLAVVDFTDLAGNVTELGRFLAEELSVALVLVGAELEIVDRTQLNKIFQEQTLSFSGAIDPASVQKVGQIAGVDALIAGTITDLGDTIRLTLKILATDTGRIVSAARTTIPKTLTITNLMEHGVIVESKGLPAKSGGKGASQRVSLDDVVIECWGDDISDGRIGGWKSAYPHCVLDDGGGGQNAIYDGTVKLENNQLCITMERLSTLAAPLNTLAVGFKIALNKGSFSDGSKSKVVEMGRFSGRPQEQPVTKCFDIK